jgi:hypothetical protein
MRLSLGWAVLLAFCATALSMPAQATMLPIVGGPGGTPFEIRCPSGKIVTGFHAQTGAWIDGLAILCATPGADDRQQSNWVGGHSGGPQERYCANGEGANALFLTFTIGHGKKREYLNSLGWACGPAPDIQQCIKTGSEDCDYRHTSAGSAPFTQLKRPIPADKLACGEGEVVAGLTGRAGKFIDAVGLICGPIPAPPSNGVPAPKPVSPTVAASSTKIGPAANQGAVAVPNAAPVAPPVSPPSPPQPAAESDSRWSSLALIAVGAIIAFIAVALAIALVRRRR